MKLLLPYGQGSAGASLDWARCLGTLLPEDAPPIEAVETELNHALDHPIGMDGPVEAPCRSGDTVAIVVSDASRKTAVDRLLPRLIERLLLRGIHESDIWCLIATGVHRPSTTQEQSRILGTEVFKRLHGRIHNHDAHDPRQLVRVGRTSRGIEVFLNRRVCESNHVFLTGAVVFHYFAGFGGGRKTLVPGAAGAQTIARNHALSLHSTEARLHPAVQTGVLDGNPVAEDMLEAAQLRPPRAIINTVLNRSGGIAGIFAGELDAAHRAACACAARIYAVPIREKADLVIAAAPNATNFIQSHKALVNAFAALKPDGRAILLAPAPEGLGAPGFRRSLARNTLRAILDARHDPDVNGQTALSTLEKGPRTLLVTEMDDEEAALTGAQKAKTLEQALALARAYFEERGLHNPTCHIMPDAGATVPVVTASR